LLPGLGSSSDVWKHLWVDLQGYEVHLIEVKGFAGLPAEDNAGGEILAPVADEIARCIHEEDLTDISIIGHSMGGTIATLIAARFPEDVDRLMVVDIPAFFGAIMGVSVDQIDPIAGSIRLAALSRSSEERERAETAFVEAGVLSESERRSWLICLKAILLSERRHSMN